jgi:hypothetical protein
LSFQNELKRQKSLHEENLLKEKKRGEKSKDEIYPMKNP